MSMQTKSFRTPVISNGTKAFLTKTSFGEKNYVLFLSIAVGIISGLAAVALKSFTEQTHTLTERLSALGPWTFWLIPALPAVGIFFCIIFVRYWIRGPYDKSLAGVISSTFHGTSEIRRQNTYSHIFTSGISVGLGLSAGLEAPIALTGSAIGSNTAKMFRLGREGRTLLLACGGAAGISAIFNSPVAGALFACEILLPEFSVPALVPLLMASASAAVVSEILYSEHTFIIDVTSWDMQNLPFYVLLGICAGVVSGFVIKSSLFVSGKMSKINNVWLKGLLGSILLYATFLFLPMLRGEGYDMINHLVSGSEGKILASSPLAEIFSNPWSFLILAGFLVFIKAAISSVGLESGGDGGIFAPSMFTGAFLGFFTARFLRLAGFIGSDGISEKNFIAVGMGGVLSGVMHAPMTGMFLIAEITGGYTLFIPLMIVASLSCFICKKISAYNVYKSVLVRNGDIPEVAKDYAPLEGLTVNDLVENDFTPLNENDTLRTLLNAVMGSRRNVFPVLDAEGRLTGIVTLDSVRPFLLSDDLYDVALVYDVMSTPGPMLDANDKLSDATKLFESCGKWNLPVVRDGKFAGFVSKSGVFEKYRALLHRKKDLF